MFVKLIRTIAPIQEVKLDKNVLIIGLAEANIKRIAVALAEKLNRMYMDVDELIEYQLVNKQGLKKVGREYFEKIQKGCIRQACDCVNTVVTISTDLYLFADYAEILSKFYVIFVNFTKNDYLFAIESCPKERQLELKNRVVVFNELNAQLRKRANLCINYSTDDNVVDKILIKLCK